MVCNAQQDLESLYESVATYSSDFISNVMGPAIEYFKTAKDLEYSELYRYKVHHKLPFSLGEFEKLLIDGLKNPHKYVQSEPPQNKRPAFFKKMFSKY